MKKTENLTPSKFPKRCITNFYYYSIHYLDKCVSKHLFNSFCQVTKLKHSQWRLARKIVPLNLTAHPPRIIRKNIPTMKDITSRIGASWTLCLETRHTVDHRALTCATTRITPPAPWWRKGSMNMTDTTDIVGSTKSPRRVITRRGTVTTASLRLLPLQWLCMALSITVILIYCLFYM